jgi:hypothetical protein
MRLRYGLRWAAMCLMDLRTSRAPRVGWVARNWGREGRKVNRGLSAGLFHGNKARKKESDRLEEGNLNCARAVNCVPNYFGIPQVPRALCFGGL